jgi:hypothetical protein
LSVKARFLRNKAASHKGQRIGFFGDNHIYYPTTLDLLLGKSEDKARFSSASLGIINEHQRQLTDLQKTIDSQAEVSDVLLANVEKYLAFLASLRCVVEIEAGKLDGQLTEQVATGMINAYLRNVFASGSAFPTEQVTRQCPSIAQ